MVFILYFIRILLQKGFQNSRKWSNFNQNARNFVCGWGSAFHPRPLCGGLISPPRPLHWSFRARRDHDPALVTYET